MQLCFNNVPAIGTQPHTDTWTNYPGNLNNLNSVNVNFTITFKNCNGFNMSASFYEGDGRYSLQNALFATSQLASTNGSWIQAVLGNQTLSQNNHVVTGTLLTPYSGLTTLVVNDQSSTQSKAFVIKCMDSTTFTNMWYSDWDPLGSGASGTSCAFLPRYHSQTVPLAPSPFTPSINFEVEAVDANIGTFTLKFRYVGTDSSVINDMMNGNMYAKIHKRSLGPTMNNSVTSSNLHTSETTKVFQNTDLEASPYPASYLFFWVSSGPTNHIHNATIDGACMSSVKSMGTKRMFNFIPLCTEVHVQFS